MAAIRLGRERTVYRCREYEPVAVPLRSLMDDQGNLTVYPEIAGRGLFDIDYVRGALALKSRGHVGYIPISDAVAIHVEPRTTIGDLLYMVWRSGKPLAGLDGFIRTYRDEADRVDSPEELYVSTFVEAMRDMRRVGALRTYCERDVNSERRGRFLMGQTVARHIARGQRHRHIFRMHELTADNLPNRILKFTVQRLMRHFEASRSAADHQVVGALRRLLALVANVDATTMNGRLVARSAIRTIRGLPKTHLFYEPALWLSFLIATKSGISMEQVGRARFESIVIDAAAVFESYVRTLCREAVEEVFAPGCRLFDGNQRPVPLFLKSNQYSTQPDYYFRTGPAFSAVADAKYKPKLAASDRYELLAFCEALNVKNGAFICPMAQGQARSTLIGTTASGRAIYVVTIDLAATDLRSEEIEFKRSLGAVLHLLPDNDKQN